MKVSNIFNQKNLQFSLLMLLFASLNSCGTYQSTNNGENDGIYASNNQAGNRNEAVIVGNQSNFDQNYFSNQLDDLQNLKQEDTFTDIDDYYYDGAAVQDDQLYTNYNEPWGYNGDVVININSGYGYMSPNYYWYNPFYYPYNNYYPYYYNPWGYNYYNPYYSYGYNPYRYEYYGYYGNYYNPYNSYYHNYPYYYGRNYDSYGKRTSRNTGIRSYDNTNRTTLSRRSSIQNNSARGNVNTSTRRATDGNLNRNNTINRNNSIDRQPTRSNNTTIQRGSNNNTIQRSSSTRRNSSYNFSPSTMRYYSNERASSVNRNANSAVRVNPNNSGTQNYNTTSSNIRRENEAYNVRTENNANTVKRENNTNVNTRSSGHDSSTVNRSSNNENRSSSSQSSSSNSSSRSSSRRNN